MKPDYKNWMPNGMVLGTLAGAVGCFGLAAVCGCTGLIKCKKTKTLRPDGAEVITRAPKNELLTVG